MQLARLRLISIVVSITLIVVLAACSSARAPEQAGMDFVESVPSSEMQPVSVSSNAIGQTDQGGERIVIKNADMTIVVTDPAVSMDRINRMAEEMGGFVVKADLNYTELNNGRKVPRAVAVIRVPAERLNEALDKIRAESGQDPISESINSQDVTSEYTDLQSRLRNEQAAEAQLMQIMEQASRTEDVLNVYNQLVQVRERIEVLQGQIKYYEESAALSSITTQLLVDEAVQPLTVGRWQLGGAAKQAAQSLLNTLEFLSRAFIWVVIYLLPVLLVIFVLFVLPIIILVRFWRRRRARNRAEAVTVPGEKPTDQA
jgi:hypothetical protein